MKELNAAELHRRYIEGEQADQELFAEQRSNILLVAGEHYTRKNSKFWVRIRDNKEMPTEAKLRLMAFAVRLHSAVQAVQVEGDSMAPSYPANSRVLIDKTNHNPALNKVVVYSLPNGSKVFGRVVAVNGDSYQVKVDNTSYNIPERTITSKDIVGVVTD
jgi:hypothetical protein